MLWSLTFKVNPSLQPINNLSETKEVDVAVGNTSTEAWSAYLANRIIHQETQLQATSTEADLQKACSQLEDQLEALHIADRLEGRKLDIGFKFKEARHEKEFSAVSGGRIWTIRPEQAAHANDSADREHVALPEELAHSLNQLNIRQQAFDRDCDEIESMQKQLFAKALGIHMVGRGSIQHSPTNSPIAIPARQNRLDFSTLNLF